MFKFIYTYIQEIIRFIYVLSGNDVGGLVAFDGDHEYGANSVGFDMAHRYVGKLSQNSRAFSRLVEK